MKTYAQPTVTWIGVERTDVIRTSEEAKDPHLNDVAWDL